jgi:outer membrane protein insertion porin family
MGRMMESASSLALCRFALRVAAPWLLIALLLYTGSITLAGKKDELPADGVVTQIRIEGLVSLTPEQVRAKLLTKPGSPLDARRIDADIKNLNGTKWFTSVEPYYDKDAKDSSGKGYILIFTVQEAPVITRIEYRGMTKLKIKDVEATTDIKKGSRADSTRTHLAVGQIKRLYEEKGYEDAEVRLVEGGKTGDTKIVFDIFEGEQHVVRSIDFEGNVFANDAMLRTKITSKTRLLGVIGGKYHRDNLEEDQRKLKEYYQSQGFHEVQVTPVTRTGSSLGDIHLTFVISEKTRYRVRNISFEGNKKISTEKLREGLALHSGQPILESVKEADRKNLISKYNALGCIDTQILPEPRFTDEPGVVDIVYKIEEGEPFLLGELKNYGNERTKDKVLRREAAMAGLIPGEPLDLNRLDIYKRRISSLGYFVVQAQPGQGKPLEVGVDRSSMRPNSEPYGKTAIPFLSSDSTARMQDPGPTAPAPGAVTVPVVPGPGTLDVPAVGPPPLGGPTELTPFGADDRFTPPIDTPAIPIPSPGPPPPVPGVIVPPRGTPPLGMGEPAGSIPSLPGMNANDVGPDRQDPFPNRNYADVITSVEEAPTGNVSIGFGASSLQGLYGNVSLTERNFDITNLPRSWNDIFTGNAFRGGGQQVSVMLMPGTLINRFQVSFRDPYVFDLPLGLNTSGYLFNRLYPDWSEARGGGRFSLGRQFGTQTYADAAFRIEDVNFYGFTGPAPPDYLAAQGHTTLASIRPSLRFDNRNSPFMPNKGQYLEFSFEQGWGTFTYPKFEVEGRAYFPTGSRPDGSGKRFVTVRGHYGVTGRDTPVYERFFAGSFGSLRGFQYRGVGPFDLGKNVGGLMTALGSVEYQFPLTANDMFHQVVFCDFGTVSGDYNIDNFRVSVGTGLRVVIPAFGQLPLCFDLAFPIEKGNGDRVQNFCFSIGAQFY